MKLSKTIVTMLLFSFASSFTSEKKEPSVSISYEQRKPSDFERDIDALSGAIKVGVGFAGLLIADMLEIHKPNSNPAWYRTALRTFRTPFYASTLYGTYLMNKGLFAKYYNSNYGWDIHTKNYHLKRSPKSSSYPIDKRKTTNLYGENKNK